MNSLQPWTVQLCSLQPSELPPHCIGVTQLFAVSTESCSHNTSTLQKALSHLAYIDNRLVGEYALLSDAYVFACSERIQEAANARRNLSSAARMQFQAKPFEWPPGDKFGVPVVHPSSPLSFDSCELQGLHSLATMQSLLLDCSTCGRILTFHRMECLLFGAVRAPRLSLEFDLNTGSCRLFDLVGGCVREHHRSTFVSIDRVRELLPRLKDARLCDGVRVERPPNLHFPDEAHVRGPCNLGYTYDTACAYLLPNRRRPNFPHKYSSGPRHGKTWPPCLRTSESMMILSSRLL